MGTFKRILIKKILFLLILILLSFLLFVYVYIFDDDSELKRFNNREVNITFVNDKSEKLKQLYLHKPSVLILFPTYRSCKIAEQYGYGPIENKARASKIKQVLLDGMKKQKDMVTISKIRWYMSSDERIKDAWDNHKLPDYELMFLVPFLGDEIWNNNFIDIIPETNLRSIEYTDEDYSVIAYDVLRFIYDMRIEEDGFFYNDWCLLYAAALYYRKSLSEGNNQPANHELKHLIHNRLQKLSVKELEMVLKIGTESTIYFPESKRNTIPHTLKELAELWYNEIHNRD